MDNSSSAGNCARGAQPFGLWQRPSCHVPRLHHLLGGFLEFVCGIIYTCVCLYILCREFCLCIWWGISGSSSDLRPCPGLLCSSALVALQMMTCAHNIAAQAEPQSVIDVSCAQASKQTFSSKADVKLCATNALILAHDDVISMRMIFEAEKPLSNVPSAPWPFLRHK